jgi:hypothetical protein
MYHSERSFANANKLSTPVLLAHIQRSIVKFMSNKPEKPDPAWRALEKSLGRKSADEVTTGRPGAVQDAPVPPVGKGSRISSEGTNTISSDTKAVDRAFGQSQQAGRKF